MPSTPASTAPRMTVVPASSTSVCTRPLGSMYVTRGMQPLWPQGGAASVYPVAIASDCARADDFLRHGVGGGVRHPHRIKSTNSDEFRPFPRWRESLV